MKKLTSILLSMTLILTLAACGGGGNGGQNKEAPDLNKYYEDFMASLGADNQPAMGDVEGEQLAAVYPGLENYAAKQSVLKMAMISAVAFEFALVELENEADAKAVADIFQARIDYQVGDDATPGGAWYPETIEGWKTKSRIVSHGNYVMLAVGDASASAVEEFEALFA